MRQLQYFGIGIDTHSKSEELIIKDTDTTGIGKECKYCGGKIQLRDVTYRKGEYYHSSCRDKELRERKAARRR